MCAKGQAPLLRRVVNSAAAPDLSPVSVIHCIGSQFSTPDSLDDAPRRQTDEREERIKMEGGWSDSHTDHFWILER